MKKLKCCLCDNAIENEYGNSPWPVCKDDTARCCNQCNITKVIPARLLSLKESRET